MRWLEIKEWVCKWIWKWGKDSKGKVNDTKEGYILYYIILQVTETEM